MTTIDDFEFDIWFETFDPSFVEINIRSQVNPKWLMFKRVYEGKYANSILKPVHRYAEWLYPYPELISIDGNTVRLRQTNMADFFLLEDAVKEKITPEDYEKPDEYYFKHLDRPHVRQYYQSANEHELPKDCFPGLFKLYMPWIVDANVTISIEQPDNVESPVFIYGHNLEVTEIPGETEVIEPHMIPFHFKKVGSHMVDDKYGKLLRGSPMYDIVFDANDIIVSRIKEFYANN